MHRRRITTCALAASTLAFVVGCSVSPEQRILGEFFRAAKLRDNITLGSFATTTFDPRKDGVVQSFDVVSIGEEQSTPLPLKDYAKAVEDARAANAEYTQQKRAYQNANLTAIQRIVKATDAGTPVAPRDRKIQGEWDKWASGALEHLKAVSDAEQQLDDAKAIAELSLSQPNGPMFDATKFDGVMISKEIVLNATVRDPSGQTSTKKLVAVLKRPQMKDENGKDLLGRWIVTSVKAS